MKVFAKEMRMGVEKEGTYVRKKHRKDKKGEFRGK